MNEHLEWCSSLLILLTGVVSYFGFQNPQLEDKLIFNPERILAGKEQHRLVTAAFLHAGWVHLLLNMISLCAFGSLLAVVLGRGHFLAIYFGAVIGGNLLSLYVHRHHEYLAYGASGGVCGLIFAYVLLDPYGRIGMIFVPIYIPAWMYAIAFMLWTFYGLRKNRDNIGHDAHLGGAVVGLLIAVALDPWLVRRNPGFFCLLLGASLAILLYLWFNPLFLPLVAFRTRRAKTAAMPAHRREKLEIDAILDKISARGLESLTAEERAMLDQASSKYRRREESKKPESGLPI